jgi:hypothetical protein
MSEKREECPYAAIKTWRGTQIVPVGEVGDKEILFYVPKDMYNQYKDKQKQMSEIETYCKPNFPAKPKQ